ncbi:transposable element Tcb2 transposase [Trichonephila clavipes]|nr:transposable element Tcb2 transposase [Trichonephila clavipes]
MVLECLHGGIILKGQTEFHTFDVGSLTGDCYCDIIIFQLVSIFQGAVGPDFTFMDNNVRPQRTSAVQELLKCKDIYRMDCPAAPLIEIPSNMIRMLLEDSWLQDRIHSRTPDS